MTAKKKILDERGVLESDMQRLMRPETLAVLKEHLPVTIQQFLLRWQAADHAILSEELKIELKEFLREIYLHDNKSLCKNVATVVSKELSETLSPIWIKLEELSNGQKDIMATLAKINLRMEITEKQVFEIDEKRLVKLEKYSSWKSTILRGLAYIIAAAALALALVFQFHHKMK
jgi:hypothetical protein